MKIEVFVNTDFVVLSEYSSTTRFPVPTGRSLIYYFVFKRGKNGLKVRMSWKLTT